MGYYSNGEGFLPTACPSCVYNFLRKEQLQAEDFKNVEYAKAKPWEIWKKGYLKKLLPVLSFSKFGFFYSW